MERAAEKKIKFIFLLAFIYAVFDMLNSASAGNNNTKRGIVYVFLIATVGFMAIFVFLKSRVFVNPLIVGMCLFFLYHNFLMFIVKGVRGWDALVYLGLSAWWILTILFVTDILRTSINCYYIIENFSRLMFVFYSAVIIYGSINIVNNSSVDVARVGYIYHLLALFPLLLIEQNKNLRLVYIVVTIFFSIYSFKRGAIIILPIMLLVYYLTESKIGASKSNFVRFLLISIAVVIVWVIIDYYTGGALSERFTEEELADGSGRLDTWKAMIENLSKRNSWQLFFGFRNDSESTLSTGAHNEWLGHLSSYGILGFILFILIIFSIIKLGFSLIKRKSILAPAYMAMCVFVLGVCTVSGFYFVHSTFYVMIFIATTYTLSFENEDKVRDLLNFKKVKKL